MRKKNVPLRVLHELHQVVEENVSVAIAEAVHLVTHFAGVVVDRETALPRFEVLMTPDAGHQFLTRSKKANQSAAARTVRSPCLTWDHLTESYPFACASVTV